MDGSKCASLQDERIQLSTSLSTLRHVLDIRNRF
jgi:hypothetical protein